MKPIKYPVEVNTWRIFDENGNGQIEIRDADRNFVFYLRIKGREVGEMNRLKDELTPLVARLLNDYNKVKELAKTPEMQSVMASQSASNSHEKVDSSPSNGKGHKMTPSERMKAYWANKRAAK